MPPVWNGGHPDYDVERDFVGYGEAGLNPKWPNKAKIAVSFVINYEEGGERSVQAGDGVSESNLIEKPGGTNSFCLLPICYLAPKSHPEAAS